MQSMAMAQPASEDTDATLADAARAGDTAAFAKLVDRYRDTAFAYANAHVRYRDEAEDIVQEAFVRAFVSLPGIQSSRSWGAWLMRIVRNLCHDSLRRHRSRPSEPLDETWPDDRPGPETSLLVMETGQEVRRAVLDLPEKLRIPMLMHYAYRRSHREIALALGVPETTVVGRLTTALQRLRRRMGCVR